MPNEQAMRRETRTGLAALGAATTTGNRDDSAPDRTRFTGRGEIPRVLQGEFGSPGPTASELAYGDPAVQMKAAAVAVTDASRHPLPGPPSNKPIRTEEDLTHQVDGPLGRMTVVPDNYAGPMPSGAVRKSDYQRMVTVYGNIASGRSSVQFDMSSFFESEDGKDLSLLTNPVAYLAAMAGANEFKQQYMGYLQELVRTPAGLQLLETLDSSKYKTRIQHGEGGNATNADVTEDAYVGADGAFAKGTGSKIWVDPRATEWDAETCTQGRQPWMKDRPRWGFYHELVHAYHNSRGDAVTSPRGHGWTLCGDPKELLGPSRKQSGKPPGSGPTPEML
jgi:hypothetical protein